MEKGGSAVPEVTVVIPTHDRWGLLRLTLHSVLSQQGVDLEVVVVDDGSSDETPEALDQVRDRRVRVVRHEIAKGVSAARNRGAALASGDWLAFVDDDDLWAPDKLASQLRAAGRDGRSWAYVGAVSITSEMQVVGGRAAPAPQELVHLLRRYNAVPGGGSNVVVRRELFERVGPFDTRLYNTEDWEMWLRLANQGLPAMDPRPLLAYRVHTGNASLRTAEILAGAQLIEQLHDLQVDRGVLHRWIAESSLRVGDRVGALRHLLVAARHGQAAGVADDVTAIVRRRLSRRFPRFAATTGEGEGTWTMHAQGWLSDLALTGSGPVSSED